MTTEEKAKAYDKAIKRAKALYDNNQPINGNNVIINNIFPELKESEDERIRDEIVLYIGAKNDISLNTHNRWLSWLEKQGEQKPVISDDALREGIAHFGITQHQITNWLKKYIDVETQSEKKHKFNIGDIISNGRAVFRVDNITKNCIGQDCYFLVNVEDEKKGLRYLILTDLQGNHSHFGEITWLCEQVDKSFEKQCELKLVDKVEPKFEIGDWVVTDKNNVVQIKAIENGKYILENTMRFSVNYVDKCWRKWDISDAKDGDVLATDNGNICIFDGTFKDDKYPFAYCGFTRHRFEIYDRRLPFTHNNIYPATKEQYNTLMKAMADAGYAFDFEKKELKNVEQKTEENNRNIVGITPNWSKEDDYLLNETIKHLEALIRIEKKGIDCDSQYYQRDIDWLKSIKGRVQPQNRWKPSKEQIDALEYFVRSVGESGYASPYENNTKLLYSLYEQLKKLK